MAATILNPLSWLRFQFSRVAYRLGVKCYRHGALGIAVFFLRMHIWATGQSSLLAACNTNGCPNPTDYASFERSFRDFLTTKAAEWVQHRPQTVPHLQEPGEPGNNGILRDLSVLVVTPRYINSSNRYIENDFIDHYHGSLVAAGVKAECFYSDRCSYAAIMGLDPRAALEELSALRHMVAVSRPDILLLDINFIGQDGSLSAGFVAELQRDFGTRLIGVISDGWGDYGRAIADYWAPVCDLIVHIAPGGEADRRAELQSKLLCTAFPVNPRHFYRQSERSFDVSFFGSYGTYLRAFWLASVARLSKQLALRDNLRGHDRTSDCPAMAEYAAIVRKSLMVLNFSARSPGVKVMTGRVWQATNSGVVLLEEANEPVEHYFAPFVHFIPFENARQLAHIIEFFKKNGDWAERVGGAAAEFCAQHYSAERIWSRVFDRLYRDQTADATLARH